MKKPEIIIIAALAESNRVIAKNGKLPWEIPKDSQRFKDLTLNHTVIMGRKTWENDLDGCPLTQRNNIVVSSQPQKFEAAENSLNYPFELLFVNSIEEAFSKSNEIDKIFVAGGASIYARTLEIADTLELTLVEGDFEGDTFFPEYEDLIGNQFEMIGKELHPGFRFETYKRISQENR